MSRLAIGVIGLGYWGTKIAREYLNIQHQSGRMRLAAVCDTRREQVEAFRDRSGYPRKRTFSDMQDFLKSGIEGVHICTPNDTHYEIANSALDEGRGILVEKPLTTKYADGRALVRKGRDLNLPVLTGQIYRFNAAVKHAAKLVKDGDLGRISHIKIEWKALATFRDPKRDILFDLGPHPFDITNMLVDEWPDRVEGWLHDVRRVGVDEVAYLHAAYKNRKVVHIELSWVYPSKTRSVSVIGERKSLHIDCLNQIITMHPRPGRSVRVKSEKNNAMRSELLYFGECCDGLEDSIGLGDVGLKVTKVLETVRLHSDRGS